MTIGKAIKYALKFYPWQSLENVVAAYQTGTVDGEAIAVKFADGDICYIYGLE